MFIAASGRKTGSLPAPPFAVQIGDTLNRSESSVNHGFQQFALSFNRTAVCRIRNSRPTGAGDQDSIKAAQDVEGEKKEAQARVLEVPWRIVRRGGRTEMVLEGVPVRTHAQTHEGLVAAMVRAWQWKDEILAGKVSTIQALAQREELTSRYVMRVLRLSFLAPDLIDAILTGRQPADLTLEPFRRPIPLEWAAQRKFFGCIPSSRP